VAYEERLEQDVACEVGRNQDVACEEGAARDVACSYKKTSWRGLRQAARQLSNIPSGGA
jgi:hypothetical protein